ncbi:hypothetical protein D5018_19070 [Parashewanella curva]|uniref:DNA-binding protein n=1 Tax=Parashewanella curva TaxID=2338552 RepID=A0A3L8PTG8_9GAMM|nr:hypothetical protein [Parashewanella curva]RLV58099.1 hypothetical protein D5018_19070 [Parashewanella curva]
MSNSIVGKSKSSKIQQIWYSKHQLCKYLGVTYPTLVRWSKQHEDFPKPEMLHLCPVGRYDIRKVEAFLYQKPL